MNVFILFVLGLTYVCTTHAYVYVQVQKGDKDTSNVDALIHKEVPSESVGAITDQLKETFQKKKMAKSKYKRFEVRKRTDEKTSQEKQDLHDSGEMKKPQDNVLAVDVDTNAKAEPPAAAPPKITGIDIVDKLLNVVKDLDKSGNNPLMRAREEYNISPVLDTWKETDSVVRRYVKGLEQPEIIKFRNSEKPSLKFEVNSDSIVKLAKELLSSPTVRSVADELAQKAAIIFRVIKEELKKDE